MARGREQVPAGGIGARLALVGEPPYGPPERPLPWQSSDAEGPEVNVARDAATARVFVGVTGRDVNVTLRFDEGAWTGAWRALYAQLGGAWIDVDD